MAGKRLCIVAAVASLAVLLGAIILSVESAGRLEANAQADNDDLELATLLAEGKDDWSPDNASPSPSSIGEASPRQSRSRKGGGRGSGATSVTKKNSVVSELAIADVLSISTKSGLRSRCAENESLARLELNTDRYPWETSWIEILDREQEIISSGPPEGSNYARENRLAAGDCHSRH